MQFICTHCERRTEGTPYRVHSDDSGVTLLDQLICSLCAIEARCLKLTTVKMTLPGEARALHALEAVQDSLCLWRFATQRSLDRARSEVSTWGDLNSTCGLGCCFGAGICQAFAPQPQRAGQVT
jgi:hypothetical protein